MSEESSKGQEVQERFETFLKRVSEAAEGLDIIGIAVAPIFRVETQEEGKVLLTITSNAYLPPTPDALDLYRMRDEIVGRVQQSATTAVEVALKAALTPPAEAQDEEKAAE